MASIGPAIFDSPHFDFQSPVLSIQTSDAKMVTPAPFSIEPGKILERSDIRCQAKAMAWLKKLGTELAQDYLAVDIADSPIKRKKKKYWLHNFPWGYTFYMKQRGETAVATKGRYDCYLVGKLFFMLILSYVDFSFFLIGAGRIFRSPKEFVCHAAWLMAGMPNYKDGYLCACKYCTPSAQLEINKRIKDITLEVMRRLQEARRQEVVIDRGVNAMLKPAYLKPVVAQRQEILSEAEQSVSDGGKSMDQDDLEREKVKDMVVMKRQEQYLKSKGVLVELPSDFWPESPEEIVQLPPGFWDEGDDEKVQALIKFGSVVSPDSAKVRYVDLPH
jgi:hypothetical protein